MAGFVRLATSLDLRSDILDPKAVAASGLNCRYVESALASHALQQRLAVLEAPARPLVQTEPHRTVAVS